ncbi:hypothetical protein JXO59_15460 [candidate division KSB1 bacterium]|nr:hypothetical protein [candidate division KSB1 bacterium]
MKKQLLSVITVFVLSGCMLLGLFSAKTYSFIQTEKSLAISRKNTEINEGSKQSVKKARLIFPKSGSSIIHSVMPGPLFPMPDTTRGN